MPDLMCLYWTSSGVYPGEGDTSRFPFVDRVREASRAGFKGIGIWHTDLEDTARRLGLKEMRRVLDDHGIRFLEVEFLTDWFLDGEKKRLSDRRRELLLEASTALGAHHVKVGDFDSTPCGLPRLVEAFAELCAEAARAGATIGFEPMPSSMIHALPDCIRMVEEAGAPNGGLCLDISHMTNLGISSEDIRRIPGRRLVCVELNDATLPGSPRHDPARVRRFCGEGDLDIRGFIRAVQDAGYRGPWAVEVFSPELARLPLAQLCERAYVTTAAQFAAG